MPADNPMSVAKVALGRRLFFDPRLSLTGRTSCASCHEPERAYTDGRALAVGATGTSLDRSAPSLLNAVYLPSHGWFDPSLTTLEAQLRVPLFNTHPVEIGLAGREDALIDELRADANYAAGFAAAFGEAAGAPSIDNLIRAIAAFERTLIAGDSPFDRYVFGGDSRALGAGPKRGLALFYSARLGCAACHGGINFAGPVVDREHPTARAAFARTGLCARPVRVPTLRNVSRTAPYMHDGRFATLGEVLDHYERIGRARTSEPDLDRRLMRFHLAPDERAALLSFLEALSDVDVVPGGAR